MANADTVSAETRIPLGAVAALTLTLLGLFGTILAVAWNGGITLSTIQSDTAAIKVGVADLKASTSQLDARVRQLELAQASNSNGTINFSEFSAWVERARAAGVNLPHLNR